MNAKVWALFVAASIALLSLGAPLTVTRGLAATAAPVTVSVFASPSPNVVNLNTNWFTKYVERKFGLRFQWVIASASDANTKQDLLLASGNYPDVFWAGNFTPQQELKYGQQEVFVPLNKYITSTRPTSRRPCAMSPA
jgi:putative aldouronate transport system substrate-binding protein